MQYLFAFAATQGGPNVRFHSHIMDCAEPGELTCDAINDTVAMLKFEYGLATITVLGIQPLPDEFEHPSADTGGYVYQVSYAFTGRQGSGFGDEQIMCHEAIISMRTLREAEEVLRSSVSGHEVHLTSCVPLCEPNEKLRAQFEVENPNTGEV